MSSFKHSDLQHVYELTALDPLAGFKVGELSPDGKTCNYFSPDSNVDGHDDEPDILDAEFVQLWAYPV